jgi:hypothetical protein
MKKKLKEVMRRSAVWAEIGTLIMVVVLSVFALFAISSAMAAPGPIRLVCDKSCTASKRVKIAETERLANYWRQQPCFRDFLMTTHLVQLGNLTRAQFVEMVTTREATVTVRYYRKNNSTIGFRQPPELKINLNRKFHDRFGAWTTFSNAIHEVGHTWGLKHDSKRTKRRPFSGPYRLNRAVEACERVAIKQTK